MERYHHEEDVIGPRCGRDFGRFRSLARLCWSAHFPGPAGYPYWSGYVDAPVREPIPACYWRTQRFWDGYAWRVRICGWSGRGWFSASTSGLGDVT